MGRRARHENGGDKSSELSRRWRSVVDRGLDAVVGDDIGDQPCRPGLARIGADEVVGGLRGWRGRGGGGLLLGGLDGGGGEAAAGRERGVGRTCQGGGGGEGGGGGGGGGGAGAGLGLALRGGGGRAWAVVGGICR